MRILYFVTKSNFCGAQRHVYDMAVGAMEAGNEVFVVVGGNGILAEKLEEKGIKVFRLQSLQRDISLLKEWHSFRKLMEIISDVNPDVIHSHSSKAGGLGAFAGRLQNFKRWLKRDKKILIVFTGHGWAFNEMRNEFQRTLIMFFHWLTLVWSHVDIIVSKKTANDVSRLPFIQDKIHIIYNGIPDYELLSKEEAQDKIRIPMEMRNSDCINVGIAAEFHISKGHYYAIQGLNQFLKTNNQKVNFILCGVGEEEEDIHDLVFQLGIQDHVFFAGFVQGLSHAYKAFDIFLLPSLTEAFPYVILEAGYAGLPTIATAVGGIPEVIDDMENGILIQSRKAGEVARALQFYVESKDKMREFGDALNSKVLNTFTQDNMINETLELYKEKLVSINKN